MQYLGLDFSLKKIIPSSPCTSFHTIHEFYGGAKKFILSLLNYTPNCSIRIISTTSKKKKELFLPK